MIAASLLGLLAAWGTGCGQRGPLYLPDTDPGASEVAAAESATPEDGTADEQRADGEERE
jgi:predicted small lipoprotein YifL